MLNLTERRILQNVEIQNVESSKMLKYKTLKIQNIENFKKLEKKI